MYLIDESDEIFDKILQYLNRQTVDQSKLDIIDELLHVVSFETISLLIRMNLSEEMLDMANSVYHEVQKTRSLVFFLSLIKKDFRPSTVRWIAKQSWRTTKDNSWIKKQCWGTTKNRWRTTKDNRQTTTRDGLNERFLVQDNWRSSEADWHVE